MDEKELQALYAAMSKRFDVGAYDQFKSKMATTDDRKRFYDAVKTKGLDLGDYNQYEGRIAGVKKKDNTQSPSPSLDANSPLPSSEKVADENTVVPTVDLNKNEYERNEPDNAIDQVRYYNDLTNRTKEQTTNEGVKGTPLTRVVPDQDAIDYANEAKKKLKEQGIDADELYSEIKDVNPLDFNRISKTQLLKDKQDNPQFYQRELGRLKWKGNLDRMLDAKLINEDISPDEYHNLKTSVDAALQNSNVGDYTQQRQNINTVANIIKNYGGDKKDELLKDYATEISKVYGNSFNAGFDKAYAADPASKYLSKNALLAYHYIQDVDPDKAKQYERILIDPKLVKDKPDEKRGFDRLMQTLEDTGIALQHNSVTEELNSLYKQDKENGGLSLEQLQKGTALEEKQKELNKDSQDLDDKYVDRGLNKVHDAMQEILGQNLGWAQYAGGKTGQAVQNTLNGVWEFVSKPFMSDESNNMRELAIMGDKQFEDEVYHKTDKNKSFLTDKLVIQPDLQKQIDEIKNDPNLDRDAKEKKLLPLLYNNKDKFGRIPIQGGQFNINPSSILYGVTDIGATLLPYIGLEALTGGGATASLTRKFLSNFTSAAATAFHDTYANDLMEGKSQADAYRHAMFSTAISSFAMAGAQTPEAIRAMAGLKTSAGQLISKMTDAEIEAAIKNAPKAIKVFGKDIQPLIERAKATPSMFAKGVKSGVQFEGAMTAANEAKHQLLGDSIDRESNFKQSVLNILNFGILGAGLGHVGYKSPTELQKSAFVETGKNPTEFTAKAEQMQKDGVITPVQLEQIKSNIENASAAYNNLPTVNDKGHPLSEKEKSDYLYNEAVKNEALKKSLPIKQKEKAEHIALVSDFKNSLILEPKTDKQLESRKAAIEKSLIPEKDANGKELPVDEKTAKEGKAEIEAIDAHIEERKKETDTKLSQPIEGLDEQGVPTGDNVPAPTNPDVAVEKGNIPDNVIPLKESEEKANEVHQPTEVKSTSITEAKVSSEAKDPIQVVKDNAADVKLPVYQDLIKNGSEEDIYEVLKDISSQWHDEKTRDQVERDFGKPIVDAAVKSYPMESDKGLSIEEPNTVGVSHGSLKKIADKMGLEQPERGTFLSPREQNERGRLLLQGGADPMKVAEEFRTDGKVNADMISVARAHFENLTREAQTALEKHGKNSPEYAKAKFEMEKWSREILKPMGTASGSSFSALQGDVDLDTGSYVQVERAVEEKTGKKINAVQEKKITELTNKNKALSKRLKFLQDKFTEIVDNGGGEYKGKSYKEKAKGIADKFRKLKTKEFKFKDSEGNEIDVHKQGVSWNDLVEVGAKAIEKTGQVLDGVKAIVDAVKGNDWYKKMTNADRDKFEADLAAHFNEVKEDAAKTKFDDLVKMFADKTDNKFTPEEVKAIWDYAKDNYLNKGRSVNEMIKGVSIDLGLTSKQVLSALEQPKGAKKISDEMFAQQNKNKKAENEVKQYIRNANTPFLTKALKAVPNFFFQKAVFGHGTVGMITHGGMNIFRPSIAKVYWPLFFKQFKNSFGNRAAYEKSMEHMKNDPLFMTAKRAGVKVDPTERNDEYVGLQNFFGKVGAIGDRGFNTLKEFRLAMFKNEYNRLSDAQKADPDTLKEIGRIVNHATGTNEMNPNSWLSTAVFAPKLEASKWARIITDPAKALNTFGRWNKATLAEKTQAKIVARKAGETFATYLTGLAINQALLYAMGSKQSVNFTDPTKKDWLKYKVGGETVDLSGGIIPTLGFIGHLLSIPFLSKGKGDKSRIDETTDLVFDYGTSKLSPFGSTIKDAITSHDFVGNTMPWSDDKPKNKYNHKLTWKEYLFNNQAPIPVAEASRSMYEAMKERGMSEPQIEDVFTGIMKGLISGGTGAKVGTDFSTEDSKHKSHKK